MLIGLFKAPSSLGVARAAIDAKTEFVFPKASARSPCEGLDERWGDVSDPTPGGLVHALATRSGLRPQDTKCHP